MSSALTDGAAIEELALRIRNAPADAAVAWDTETNARRPSTWAKPELELFAGAWVAGLSVSLVTPQDAHEGRIEGFYVPIAHRHGNAPPGAVQRLLEALAATPALVLEHHGAFDRWGIGQVGPVPSWRHLDTQVTSWLEDENRRKGLKYLGSVLVGEDADREARELGELRAPAIGKLPDARRAVLAAYPELGKVLKSGKVSTKTPNEEGEAMARRLKATRTWSDLTVGEIAPYAARDATLTYEVAHALMGGHDAIIGFHKRPGLAREMELQRLLHDMTVRGVGAYVDRFRDAESLYQQRADAIGAEVDKCFGDAYRRWSGSKQAINVNSDKTIEWLLFDHLELPSYVRTDAGGRSTAKGALSMLTSESIVRDVLEYRRWQHAVDSYARPFGDYAEQAHDERIHGHFASDSTVTGRLAASHPNVMTIPKDNTLPEIRSALSRVAPGLERTSFDLASAELWVTASITQDQRLTQTLFEQGSMHLDMMEEVWGFRDKEDVLYTIAKNVNYSMAYEAGIGPIRLYCAAGGIPYEESTDIAFRILRAHKRLYRGLHGMSSALTEMARERGKLPLHVPGRYRHFRSPGRFVEYYTALNALVQGGIGEYMKDVMLELVRRGYGELLILQVHDELVFDHPIGMAEELHQVLRNIADDINPFRYVIPWDIGKWHA